MRVLTTYVFLQGDGGEVVASVVARCLTFQVSHTSLHLYFLGILHVGIIETALGGYSLASWGQEQCVWWVRIYSDSMVKMLRKEVPGTSALCVKPTHSVSTS